MYKFDPFTDCEAGFSIFRNRDYQKREYMLKVEHIGIAVKTFESAIPLYERLLNTNCYKTETVASEGVNTAFFLQGDT